MVFEYDDHVLYSGFTFGECPVVLPVQTRKRLRHMRRNPALVAMPAHLKPHFPTARWLVMGSAPQGTLELLDDNFEVLEATQIHVHGGKGTISDWYGIPLP